MGCRCEISRMVLPWDFLLRRGVGAWESEVGMHGSIQLFAMAT